MADRDYTTVTNISGQLIPLQIKPPNGDFFLEERQARLLPSRSVTVPRSFLNTMQIENLKARHQITQRASN